MQHGSKDDNHFRIDESWFHSLCCYFQGKILNAKLLAYLTFEAFQSVLNQRTIVLYKNSLSKLKPHSCKGVGVKFCYKN